MVHVGSPLSSVSTSSFEPVNDNFIDSMAVGGALKKGKSSAKSFARNIRYATTMLLAGGRRANAAYVPS